MIDKITTDRPRKIETLWHWHPDCQVNINDKQVVTGRNEGGFLQIIPVSTTKWSVSMVKGQETPSIQGWYSRDYNIYEPNTASIYTTDIQKETLFAWILYPSEKQIPEAQAKIISENTDGVIVQVNHPGDGQWTLNIPFKDSHKASMTSE